MSKRIAVFGGSFNPPALHHRRLVEELLGHFDEVVVVPCGPRPDKPTTNDVDPIHRAVMGDLAFRNLDRVRVELFDLEQSTFTKTHELDDRFREDGEPWHVVGSDLTHGGSTGESFIHKNWENGPELWKSLNFAVIPREGYEVRDADLPPRSEVVKADCDGSTFDIRERAFRRQQLHGHVTDDVAEYIDRYRLYRGTVSGRSAKLKLDAPGISIFHDSRNPKANAIADRFKDYVSDDPDLIMVIGGDGTMLQAIRSQWRRRLPFFGVNAGHRGFLLNSADEVDDSILPEEGLVLRQMPLLYVEMLQANGEWVSDIAFNDSWIERASSQAAWLEVKVDGHTRMQKLVGDGILVATAAGSTAYARAMGASPLLANTPAIILVGSNVGEPPDWRSALLSLETVVEVTTLGGDKRPLNGYVDGTPIGQVRGMRVRASRIAAAELAFVPTHDMAEKIAQVQFPNRPPAY